MVDEKEIQELKAARKELHSRKLLPFPTLQRDFITANVFCALLGSGLTFVFMFLALDPLEGILPQAVLGPLYLVLLGSVVVSALIAFYISARQSAGICGGIIKLCNTMKKATRGDVLKVEDVIFRTQDIAVFHRISHSLRDLFQKFGVQYREGVPSTLDVTEATNEVKA